MMQCNFPVTRSEHPGRRAVVVRTERRMLSTTPWTPAIWWWPGSTANTSTRIVFPPQKNPPYLWKPKPARFATNKATPAPPSAAMDMEPGTDEVAFESLAHFRVFKSGRIERLNRPPVLPAGFDEATGVTSKDVVLDAATGLSVRVYLPKAVQEPSKKLPVLVYFHGGAFLIESAGSATYHRYVNPLAAAAGVLAVSVTYRLAPEHPLPAAYEDCWAALQWAASAQDDWIAERGDVARLFLAGDSAGANIVHDMLVRASAHGGPCVEGAVLLHPWFNGNAPLEGEPELAAAATAGLWLYACPGAVGGADDPRMNPLAPGAPSLGKLGCARMLVCAATQDALYVRARAYYQAVAAGAWPGDLAWHESEGEDHDFFLGKPDCDNAKRLTDCIVSFIAGA
ncbi:hypothetical protein BS78_02G206200 [Paspalum vaginatum]|nr:hypothetical protein BS78_02G206200 [Paspalum vaginatum]